MFIRKKHGHRTLLFPGRDVQMRARVGREDRIPQSRSHSQWLSRRNCGCGLTVQVLGVS